MQLIPLGAVANQTRSFTAGGSFWEIRVFSGLKSMCVDINIDGVSIVNGKRCVEGFGLLPYERLWRKRGNLIFDARPDWENFGTSCSLYYLSPDEAANWDNLTKRAGA